ncbi:MAG: sn-glycerol-1-phosphate dehydrogenase [Eubacteriales bacterium]|nr:sn-glycerol-1-phosphate dehydrogenase [Eubacteriales bacterium]
MPDFSKMTLEELLKPEGFDCACGRRHQAGLRRAHIGKGALGVLLEYLHALGITRPFVFCDENTYVAAGAKVVKIFEASEMPHTLYTLPTGHPEPDEMACGGLLMAFDPKCDGVVAVGSGVINDSGKVLAHALRLPLMCVATAPSMDGYASDSSSMVREGVKVSLYNACPQALIADTDILAGAPLRLLQAGLGDMLAKYCSVCEWRLANLVIGEYYCGDIAALMREALRRVRQAAPRLLERDAEAVEEITQGLVLAGIAMAFAGVSRPASGLEHYFSHIWEMMALARGLDVELHGIQVGIGTLLTLKIWEKLKLEAPSRETARAFIDSFDEAAWEAMVRRVFGQAAETILKTARAEGRNDKATHATRLQISLEKWPDILKIVEEELPPYQDMLGLMDSLQMPLKPEDIGFSRQDTVDALLGAREIRDKYLTSSLLWDLGLLYTSAPEWL